MSNGAKRVVAIIGRPNVGKSAIFNRLIGRRVAIVHAESGVTRDRLMCMVSWHDERFELIDTGGVCNMDHAALRNRIDAATRNQVDAAVDDAAVALLVVDITSGMVPLDEEVAGMLRAGGKTVFVVANKADNPDLDNDIEDFERLGFPVFPVSALHNRGFDSLMDAVLVALPETENATVTDPLKVAVIGRPNVGKSSYVNRLLQSDRLIVSDIPGTTRDSIDVPFIVGKGEHALHYLLIDTAGIRRVGKIDNSVERFGRFRTEKSIHRADVVALVLDAVQKPTAQDRKIASLICGENKACVILVNKWDLEETTQRQYAPEIARLMPFMNHCPVVFVSAKTGYNIRRSIEVIDHVALQLKIEIPTGVLNRTIADAYNRVHPPTVRGKQLKIFYATQVGTAPIRIALFVNDPRIVAPEYASYIIRSLRGRFGFEGVPVLLQFRARKKSDSHALTASRKHPNHGVFSAKK
ncbi:MAG: ribosome biogenesis GTPase Der [Lentisphaerae bacterium]|nr:ribosome biogenesis GTPase Der [Lentisphaerota bacterium]